MQAICVGHALDLDRAAGGAVHSVFARALNLRIGAELWTVLAADRDDLPLGIRVAVGDFDSLGLRRGDAVNVRAGFVGIGSAPAPQVIDCRSAPRWAPVPVDRIAAGLGRRLDLVAAAARDRAWRGSAALARQAVAALNAGEHAVGALAAVVGCGPGSTPAGDDVLVGILAILTAPPAGARGAAAAAAAARLAGALAPLLPTTTDISAQLLRQAAAGRFASAVLGLVRALLADPSDAPLGPALQRVIATGASSGADLCLGLVAGARWFLLTDEDERAAA